MRKLRKLELDELRIRPNKEERSRGFVRPIRYKYKHKCGYVNDLLASTARKLALIPRRFTHLHCEKCRIHCPVDEFHWGINNAGVAVSIGS